MRVLIIEDDPDLGELLSRGLRASRYAADHVGSVSGALDLLLTTEYDVVCLDLGLPDGDGLELCGRLAAGDGLQRPRRIIVVSARDAVADRIAGLDAGADDYLVKPFDLAELLARLRALHRRGDVVDAELRCGDVVVDTANHRCERAGRPIDLTAREYAVLRYLAHHPGRPVSAEELFEHVWDHAADPLSNSVRVIMSRLRRKLGEPAAIRTVTGAGYVLEAAS